MLEAPVGVREAPGLRLRELVSNLLASNQTCSLANAYLEYFPHGVAEHQAKCLQNVGGRAGPVIVRLSALISPRIGGDSRQSPTSGDLFFRISLVSV